ncbi:dephospho-CoA kinase [Butyrivibrio sp. MC2013]|uniref:dephospho-CoA kinase n=1 Tax=Butyrivibrio sp. MC2013 TaxID=1280686 RepID=UPI0003FCFC14|nr:dephospho-CoA kinase [Butyrivibrio sp. MC2013]
MRLIGVTGGVGAGKSSVLSWIENNYNCRVIYSDDVANRVKEKGMPAYDKLADLLGRDILLFDESGMDIGINKKAMADKIFNAPELLEKVNAILHPATNDYIKMTIEKEKDAGKLDYLFVEAALLIENGYKDIVDEMWYIYASEEVRRKRLKESRAYSDEKIDSIFASQLSDEIFRANADLIVDNSGELSDSITIVKEHLSKQMV